jgi:hypothetical protein
MSSSFATGVTITHADLDLLAEVAMLRFPLRAAESHRLEQMRAVLDAGADLARALESHTHCALVNHRGSHGTGDLAAETAILAAAFQRFGRLVAETAGEYRRFARESAVPADVFPLPRVVGGGARGDVTMVAR